MWAYYIELIELILCASSAGVYFHEKFRENRSVRNIAGAIALVSSFFLFMTIEQYIAGFAERASGPTAVGPPAVGPPAVGPTADDIFWLTIKDSAAAALFEEFLHKFPASPHAQEAMTKLEQLKRIVEKTIPNDQNSASTACAQQARFDQAVRGSASALRSYIGECQPLGGVFVQQAKNILETLVYNDASTCIRSSCSFDGCLRTYTNDFPTGAKLASLQNEARQAAGSQRCQPALPSTAGSVVCKNMGSFSWTCPKGYQCAPNGTCTGLPQNLPPGVFYRDNNVTIGISPPVR